MLDDVNLDYVKELPGFERGHPHYFKDPMLDHLLEIVFMLGGELWVMRDRQWITEHLLATEGKVTPEMIERFKPSKDMQETMAAARRKFTEQVFGCLYARRGAADAHAFFNVVGKGEAKEA
jgi:hypothetical protein